MRATSSARRRSLPSPGSLRRLHAPQRRPGLGGTERNALLGFANGADMDTTLEQPFFDHRVDVHERLDRYTLDPGGHQLSERLRIANCPAGQPNQGREPDVSPPQDDVEQVTNPGVGQRRSLTEEAMQ